MELALSLLSQILLVYISLLPIMNPLSTAPLFVAWTQGMSQPERTEQARRGCMYAFVILCTFMVLGDLIIRFFGISIPGIRIAGGLVVGTIGFGMLHPEEKPLGDKEARHAAVKPDISFSPLAIPFLSGPGSLALVLTITGKVATQYRWLEYVVIMLGIGLTLLTAFVVLKYSSNILLRLGPSTVAAMTRLMGFLLICVGVQFVGIGVKEFFNLG